MTDGPYRSIPDEDPVDLACQEATFIIKKGLFDNRCECGPLLKTLLHIVEAIAGLNEKINKL